MKTKIVIIGAGPGGYVAAVRAAQLGADVTVVEGDSVGGTCLNWGCIPSKIMKTTAELFHKINRAGEFGIDIHGSVSPDMRALMQRKKISFRTRQMEFGIYLNTITSGTLTGGAF